MALNSNLFKGDKKLEACEVSDPAHLTVGAKGDHVAKVQLALFALDSLAIDRHELRHQTYGPSTAKAVLAYKTKRKIINHTYQNTADDIVGKMTITRLDSELCLRQLAPTPKGDCVTGPTAPPVISQRLASTSLVGRLAGVARVGDAPTGKFPQFGKTLRIFCSITKQALLDGFPLRTQIEKAKDTLSTFGMSISLEAGNRTNGFSEVLDTGQWVIEDDLRDLRTAAEARHPGLAKILRVFVISRSPNADFGNTERNVREGATLYQPFVILNSSITNADNMTLLHEMIHASQPRKFDHDTDPTSVFFAPPPNKVPPKDKIDRTVLRVEHATQLSKAYFAA